MIKVFVDHVGCKGFLQEGYKPLPPNSPEDTYREEVENHSDAGSVATPLLENPERALVTVEDPTPHTTPVSEVLSNHSLFDWTPSGNIIEEEVPSLTIERPYTKHIWNPHNQFLMMSTGPLFVLLTW
jgi:hypothetical protein